eukprot:GHVU01191621.1.p1 GENE.GHVU01191621.1~~GHVU01191621.1.p1  ORF type:complete len:196 (-),score=30.55 GHVU01191621.1:34-543(-)
MGDMRSRSLEGELKDSRSRATLLEDDLQATQSRALALEHDWADNVTRVERLDDGRSRSGRAEQLRLRILKPEGKKGRTKKEKEGKERKERPNLPCFGELEAEHWPKSRSLASWMVRKLLGSSGEADFEDEACAEWRRKRNEVSAYISAAAAAAKGRKARTMSGGSRSEG